MTVHEFREWIEQLPLWTLGIPFAAIGLLKLVLMIREFRRKE